MSDLGYEVLTSVEKAENMPIVEWRKANCEVLVQCQMYVALPILWQDKEAIIINTIAHQLQMPVEFIFTLAPASKESLPD